MLPTQTSIITYHIYTYTFLDDLTCIINPYEYFKYQEKYKIDDSILLIGEKFKSYGWEGDGSIGIIWLPPFVDIGMEDTYGTYIWHVKQSNNGISFLASNIPLGFQRLKVQNENLTLPESNKNMIPISIIETTVDWLKKAIEEVETNFRGSIYFLSSGSSDKIKEMIKESLNIHYQGILVRYFQEFMDECYLQFLVEAINNGNLHKIKLKKSQVKIDSTFYIPESEDEGLDIDTKSWLTLQGLISDLWKAYKWEPFKNKTDMLFNSVDYKADSDLLYEIKKHVILRNCVQHHEGVLDRDSLVQLGRELVQMKGKSGTCNIKVWQGIIFESEEIYSLCNSLKRISEDFHNYVKKRVPSIHYISKKSNTDVQLSSQLLLKLNNQHSI